MACRSQRPADKISFWLFGGVPNGTFFFSPFRANGTICAFSSLLYGRCGSGEGLRGATGLISKQIGRQGRDTTMHKVRVENALDFVVSHCRGRRPKLVWVKRSMSLGTLDLFVGAGSDWRFKKVSLHRVPFPGRTGEILLRYSFRSVGDISNMR